MFAKEHHSSVGNNRVSDLAEFLQLAHFYQPSWEDLYEYLNNWQIHPSFNSKDQLCKRSSFTAFIKDPAQCGDFFIDSQTCHSHLSLCCMKTVLAGDSNKKSWNYFESGMWYAHRYLFQHVVQGIPGDKAVLDCLQNIDPFQFFASRDHWYPIPDLFAQVDENDISKLVNWLEHGPNCPRDTLSLWKTVLLEMKSSIFYWLESLPGLEGATVW